MVDIDPTELGETSGPPLTDRADFAIFTDAATLIGIIASVAISPDQFKQNETLTGIYRKGKGQYWRNMFGETSLIYGLEMMALLAKVWKKMRT